MRLLQQEFEHPTQASRVRLNLYRYRPPEKEPVAGMLPDEEGFHLTEERAGTTTVVASIGLFATDEEARQRLFRRAAELAAQGWRPAAPSPRRSVPAGSLQSSEPEDTRAVLASASEAALAPGASPAPPPAKPV